MLAWKAFPLQNCPYPLDIRLERFYTGKTKKHSALAHFGNTPVTTDLPAWFGKYNARQTIAAGNKEEKGYSANCWVALYLGWVLVLKTK